MVILGEDRMSTVKTVRLSCPRCRKTGEASWEIEKDVHTMLRVAPEFIGVGRDRDETQHFICALCHAAADKKVLAPHA